MKRTKRYAQALLALLVVTCGSSSALADWHSFWQGVHRGYARNNAWPDPFNEVDAFQVQAPFEIMKRNGWRMHNTIGHNLFRGGDGALMSAGRERIHWIVTQAPSPHRNLYVVRGSSQAETDARVAAVRRTLSTIHTDKPMPQVFVTDTANITSSGAWAVKVNREMIRNLPSPKLPTTSSSGQAGVTTPTGGAPTSN